MLAIINKRYIDRKNSKQMYFLGEKTSFLLKIWPFSFPFTHFSLNNPANKKIVVKTKKKLQEWEDFV
jgi:hypothetical protein